MQSVANAYGIAKSNGNCYCDCNRHGYSDGDGYRYANGNCHSHGDRYGYRHSNGYCYPNSYSGAEGYSITKTSSDTAAPAVRLIDW